MENHDITWEHMTSEEMAAEHKAKLRLENGPDDADGNITIAPSANYDTTNLKKCSTCKCVQALDNFNEGRATCKKCRLRKIKRRKLPTDGLPRPHGEGCPSEQSAVSLLLDKDAKVVALEMKVCSTCKCKLSGANFETGRATCKKCCLRKSMRKRKTLEGSRLRTENGVVVRYCTSCRKDKPQIEFLQDRITCNACRSRKTAWPGVSKGNDSKRSTSLLELAAICCQERVEEQTDVPEVPEVSEVPEVPEECLVQKDSQDVSDAPTVTPAES